MRQKDTATRKEISEEENMYANYKVINDSVHGHIKIHRLCTKIVDTLEFQRLRNLKQLGVANLVYPGASHNRFEHSLGVCYLARQIVEKLEENDKQWTPDERLLDKDAITETEKLCVEIAGLCHDLGHGPFSHTWERVISKWDKNDPWKHEEGSINIFSRIVSQLERDFSKDGISKKDIVMIEDLIRGLNPTDEIKYDKKKLFLFEIISNKRNGIDVDKWDYLLRDRLHLNLNSTFDYRRILEFCAVVKTDDGSYRIGYKDTEINSLYAMFRMRAEFHQKAYQHQVVKNIEAMYIDAFISAGNKGYVVNGNKRLKLKDAHKTVDSLLQLTDHVYYDILYDTTDATEDARKIFTNVCKRRLYKFVDKCTLRVNDLNNKIEELESKLQRKFPNLYEKFKISDIYMNLGVFCEENPNIILYKKVNIDNTGDNTRFKAVLTDCSTAVLRDMLYYPIERNENPQLQLLLYYDNTDENLPLDDETLDEARKLMKSLKNE